MYLHKQFKLKKFVDFIHGNQFFLKLEYQNYKKYFASIFQHPAGVFRSLHDALFDQTHFSRL